MTWAGQPPFDFDSGILRKNPFASGKQRDSLDFENHAGAGALVQPWARVACSAGG
jgi:hypothetical protein